MNFPRKLTGLILSLSLLMPTVAQPNPALRKGVHVLCAATGGLLAASPALVRYQGSKDFDKNNSYLENAPGGAAEFCREQLKRAGVKNPDKVSVKILPENHSLAGAARNTLFLTKDTALDTQLAYLDNQLNTAKFPLDKPIIDRNKVNELMGILQHEGTHLKNNDDGTSTAYFYGTGALATAHAVKKTTKELKNFSGYPLWKSACKIPSGLGKAAVTFVGAIALKRYHERRADEGIENDEKILTAIAQAFRSQHTAVLDQYDGDDTKARASYLGSTHPFPLDRAQRFEERIAKLEQEQNKN